MSESYPSNPGQTDPSVVQPELLGYQNTIRELAEGRVADSPREDSLAEYIAKDFGLEADSYHLYVDAERTDGSGFVKFVSRRDPSEVLIGLSRSRVGGPDGSIRSIHHLLLQPNGDIILTAIDESPTRISTNTSHLSANDQDSPYYKLQLQAMHARAQQLVAPRAPVAEHSSNYREPDTFLRRLWERILSF